MVICRRFFFIALLIRHMSCAEVSLSALGVSVASSWLCELEPDPELDAHAPNHEPRSVHSGHYVLVKPKPLDSPLLVAYTPNLVRALNISSEGARSETFVRVFSGGGCSGEAGETVSWSTPYALSIYGQETIPQGAGSDGSGYGDGRAVSIAEALVVPGTAVELVAAPAGRLELQLKGAGRTPFCRGADGRAVLRSSVRTISL